MNEAALNGIRLKNKYNSFNAGPSRTSLTNAGLRAIVAELQAEVDAMGDGIYPEWDVVTADAGDGTACIVFDNLGRVMWMRNA